MLRGESATVWAWEDPLVYQEEVLMGDKPGPLKVPLPPVAGRVEYSLQLEHVVQVVLAQQTLHQDAARSRPCPATKLALGMGREGDRLMGRRHGGRKKTGGSEEDRRMGRKQGNRKRNGGHEGLEGKRGGRGMCAC